MKKPGFSVMYFLWISLLSCILCLSFACSSSDDGTDEPVLSNAADNDDGFLVRETAAGSIKGKEDASDTLAWLGIPYAKPPVGELRWRAPQEAEPWEGVRDATRFGNACTQYGTILYILDEKLYGKPTGCEDCLYLNVWRPATEEKKLPVFFYIHGGANVIGASSLPVYNGANLSSFTNMVVVTVNYRLGMMGWFTHPSLRKGDKLDSSGNYGTLDLIKSLEWVRDNIDSFGGDPGNVTVCGQSAGAFNIHSLLASPLAEGLFHKAILHSGFPTSTEIGKGDERADKVISRLLIQDKLVSDEESAIKLMEEKGEDWLAEYLRSVPACEIYNPDVSTASGSTKESGVLSSGIYEDGYVIPGKVSDIMKSGGYIKVPVMLGCMSEELKLFLMMLGVETHKLHGLIKTYNPDSPNVEFKDAFPAILKPLYNSVTAVGQIVFQGIGVDKTANTLSKYQNSVYVYKFIWNNDSRPFDLLLGASHALDVPFLFGNFLPKGNSLVGCAWSDDNKLEREGLSRTIMTYWSSFARYGDPSAGNDLPEWQAWDSRSGTGRRMVFDAGKPYLSEKRLEAEEPASPGKAIENMLSKIEGFADLAKRQ